MRTTVINIIIGIVGFMFIFDYICTTYESNKDSKNIVIPMPILSIHDAHTWGSERFISIFGVKTIRSHNFVDEPDFGYHFYPVGLNDGVSNWVIEFY